MMYENKLTISTIFANYLSKISVIIMFGIGLYFYFIFRTFDMFPIIWGVYVFGAIVLVTLLAGIICFVPKIPKALKIVSLLLNIIISCILVYGSWYLPNIRAQIEKAFMEIPLVGEAEINFYVLKDEYRVQPTGTEISTNFNDYVNKTFIIQQSTDLENQEYALLVSNRQLESQGVDTLVAESIFDAVEMLYAGVGDVMVMNSSYIPMIQDITGYENFLEKVEVVYTVYKKLQISSSASSVDVTKKPFTVMIVGNDKWGSDITTTGRTDVNILATIHPSTKQISIVTIPRDAYMPNACLYNANDKLTHAGIYGIQCTEQTLENYLGIDINYYVVINFSSMVQMVDALEGIDIYNPYKFTTSTGNSYKGTFNQGDIHLDGNQALAYVRERKALSNGDIGRGEHQSIVIKAMLKKLTEPAIITRVDKVLEAMKGTFKTNMTMDEIYALAQMQLDDMAIWNVVSYTLGGVNGFETVASLDESNAYSVVYLNDHQIQFVKNIMNQIYDGGFVEQENLPK